VARSVKTGQPDPLWPNPPLAYQKWIGSDWPAIWKWIENLDPSHQWTD